jgi:hypothetical protein
MPCVFCVIFYDAVNTYIIYCRIIGRFINNDLEKKYFSQGSGCRGRDPNRALSECKSRENAQDLIEDRCTSYPTYNDTRRVSIYYFTSDNHKITNITFYHSNRGF